MPPQTSRRPCREVSDSDSVSPEPLIVDEGRKRVLPIADSILATGKLAEYDSGARIPATVSGIADAIRPAERII